jgi:phenylpropionate dioxygenase-like ring-hydroxylating dioxygenase large terminal subunit
MKMGEWVDTETGLVSREAFTSDEIYRHEIDRIFNRSWGYLGHESELTQPGDYVVRRLGDAPVIVVRLDDGNIGAFLNSCRHRGTKLCRGESGRAKNFVCPYHGWTYATDGTLITTTFDHHFPDDMDFARLNLVPVPRLETFCGTIFGCWNAGVTDLATYLGDIRWYLKSFFQRTQLGMEVLGPPHRWRVDANWKVGALNFIGDSQHVPVTHTGPLTLDKVRAAREGFSTAGEESFQVVTDEGHGCTLTYLAPGMPPENYATHDRDLQAQYPQYLAADQLELLHNLRVCVGTVFPNVSFIETQVARGQKAVIVRLWQPLGGRRMEVLSWIFAEKEAPDDYKKSVYRKGFHNFGSAGVFEQDDMELWISATDASDNSIAARYPYSFHTSLRYQETPIADYAWPGRAYKPVDTEVAQFEFMRRWQTLMQDGSSA